MPTKSQSRVQRHREPWTEAEDRLLFSRTLSNSELAEQLGRTKKSVRHRRLAKSIYNRPASRRWTEDELRLLGKLVQRGKLKACRVLRGKFLIPRTELFRLLNAE